jgi:hypothetical protein
MDLVEVKSLNNKGDEVCVYLKKPGTKELTEAKLAYNKAFRKALESGAILKAKLVDYVREQGVWDDKKEAEYKRLVEEIRSGEALLSKGGVTLKVAKEASLKLKETRLEFQSLIAERNAYDANSAESVADNAQFNQLVVCCTFKPDRVSRVWNTSDEYDNDSNEQWASDAASRLANMLYGLDPDYEKNLPENKFLVTYKFANEKLELVNKDGHLIDSEGNLIDEEGYYVKYVDEKKVRVTKDGRELDENNNVKVEFSPFLDDDGKPVEA